ncbi:MAG TPA: class II fumarate hydratase [Longimicrobium sp.]|nr:class II fumarate hydratase [Longimicrobium sp.]
MANDNGFRVEKDSLGEMRVPADALYGAQTQRAVENFPISGIGFPRRFIHALGTVKKACARANVEMGLLPAELGGAIERAADEVIEGKLDAHFVLDIFQTGSGTSSNMNANEVIATRATQLLREGGSEAKVHPNDHVNMGQSSNDVIPTAMHVSARVAIHEDLVPALERLRGALAAKAAEFDDVVKSGRTHLMDATPVRLGQEFGGYASQVEHGVRRLARASDELAELALGGTAVGTGTNAVPGFPALAIAKISELTGLEFSEAENHFEAQGAKDAYVSASGALNTLAVSLLKIANDIRWLASGPTSGLAEITLPAVQPGSSIMPGKVNPVLSEALMMVCAQVMGNHLAVTVGGQHGNFELNVMMPVMAHNFLQSVSILAKGCDAFRSKAVEGIGANRDRCRELLEKNPAIATALNAYIGYDAAAKVAKESAANYESVRDVVKRHGLLSDEQLDHVLNVREMTEPGVPGGGVVGGGGG